MSVQVLLEDQRHDCLRIAFSTTYVLVGVFRLVLVLRFLQEGRSATLGRFAPSYSVLPHLTRLYSTRLIPTQIYSDDPRHSFHATPHHTRRNNATGECTRDLWFGPRGSEGNSQHRHLVPASFAPVFVEPAPPKPSDKKNKKITQPKVLATTWFVSFVDDTFCSFASYRYASLGDTTTAVHESRGDPHEARSFKSTYSIGKQAGFDSR